MLIGHYSVALGLKKVDQNASLGLLFLAVQLADILFFPLVVLGIERGSVVPGITEASDLRLDYAPFTHGLLGALILSLAVYAVIQVILRNSQRNRWLFGLVIGIAIFSHYILDVIVHQPDMALVNGNLPKLGLGLWHSAPGTFVVEAVLMLIGLGLYLRATTATTFTGKYGMIILVGLMLLFNIFNLFQPPAAAESSVGVLTIPALAIYSLLAGAAFWLDTKRAPRSA